MGNRRGRKQLERRKESNKWEKMGGKEVDGHQWMGIATG